MTGTINPELPSSADTEGVGEGKTRNSLITLRDALNALLNSENKVEKAAFETGAGAIKWYTPKVISAEESRTSTSYGKLGTADEITGVVLPTNGLIQIGFRAHVKSSTAGEGIAAIFIGSNQVRGVDNNANSGLVGGIGTSFEAVYTTSDSMERESVTAASDATTGQIAHAGFLNVFAAAGTYAISVQYKSAVGSVTAKERKLWVAVLG